MIKLYENGAYLLNGLELVEDHADAAAVLASKLGSAPSKEEASKNTMAYGILEKHYDYIPCYKENRWFTCYGGRRNTWS